MKITQDLKKNKTQTQAKPKTHSQVTSSFIYVSKSQKYLKKEPGIKQTWLAKKQLKGLFSPALAPV